MVSVGGALGGFFVAFASPRMFRDYLELPVALVGCAALVTCVLWNRPTGEPRALWIRSGLAFATLAFAGSWASAREEGPPVYVRSVRNFYGVMHVRDDRDDVYGVPAERVLVHGTIDHGTQLKEDTKGRITTSYFGYTSGINRAVRGPRKQRGPLRSGRSGTRRGSHGHSRERRRYPALLRDQPAGARRRHASISDSSTAARRRCKFSWATPAWCSNRLPGENLDFLAMDAFSSDAVPMHLLTREAFQMYLRHLKPDGVLAVHISNRYLDLKPVVAQGMAGNWLARPRD